MPGYTPSYLTFTMPTISFDRKRRINAFKTKVINRNNTYRKRKKIDKNKLYWEGLLCWKEHKMAALLNVTTYSSFAREILFKMVNLSALLLKSHSLGSLGTLMQWSKNPRRHVEVSLIYWLEEGGPDRFTEFLQVQSGRKQKWNSREQKGNSS